MLAQAFTLVLALFIPAYCDQTIGTIEDALAEYFGGIHFVPPSVNGTYGGETVALVSAHDATDFVLNCSAKYPVRWITEPSLVRMAFYVITGKKRRDHKKRKRRR